MAAEFQHPGFFRLVLKSLAQGRGHVDSARAYALPFTVGSESRSQTQRVNAMVVDLNKSGCSKSYIGCNQILGYRTKNRKEGFLERMHLDPTRPDACHPMLLFYGLMCSFFSGLFELGS